jgi:hypothetical protein
MSRSPKYTSAELAAARERELAARRARREAERKQREEQARQQRLEAGRAALLLDLEAARARAESGAETANDAGIGDRGTALLAEIGQISAAALTAGDEAGLLAEHTRLDAAVGEIGEIAITAAGILAAREHRGALRAVRASVDSVPDHAALDAAGAAAVDRQLALAENRVGDASAFASAYASLTGTVRAHLAQAQARREALARMKSASDAARATLREVLDEATASGAGLNGVADAERHLADLAAAVAAQDVPLALVLAGDATRAGADLERAFDLWLDQLDRAQLVSEAVARALPRAGFTIVPDSYQSQETSVTIQAKRADGSVVQMAFVPDEGRNVEIIYHADGNDFVLDQTVDGEVARCDLTEEILERFHYELAKEDVVTGELHWEGKPATRPDARTARQRPKPAAQSKLA